MIYALGIASLRLENTKKYQPFRHRCTRHHAKLSAKHRVSKLEVGGGGSVIFSYVSSIICSDRINKTVPKN